MALKGPNWALTSPIEERGGTPHIDFFKGPTAAVNGPGPHGKVLIRVYASNADGKPGSELVATAAGQATTHSMYAGVMTPRS